ncbi:MAG: hypothetical protein ACWGOV_04115 [Acidiferrobacterales bacterium]
MSNFRYRLRETVTILATSEHGIKDRLSWAVTQQLLLAFPGNEKTLPKYFSEKYNDIIDTLTTKDWNGGDKVRATLHRMRKKRASEIAANVFNLYKEYEEYLHSGFIPDEETG